MCDRIPSLSAFITLGTIPIASYLKSDRLSSIVVFDNNEKLPPPSVLSNDEVEKQAIQKVPDFDPAKDVMSNAEIAWNEYKAAAGLAEVFDEVLRPAGNRAPAGNRRPQYSSGRNPLLSNKLGNGLDEI